MKKQAHMMAHLHPRHAPDDGATLVAQVNWIADAAEVIDGGKHHGPISVARDELVSLKIHTH
jgi:hypothetical protein